MPDFPDDYNTKSSALVSGDRILIADSEDAKEIKGTAPNYIFPGIGIGGNAASNTVASSTTAYCYLFGAGAPNTTELNTRLEWPASGTLYYLVVRTRNAQPGTGSLVFTVRVAGADTALTLTVAAGAAAGLTTDVSNTVVIGALQGLSLKVQNNASSASAQIAGYTIGFRQ